MRYECRSISLPATKHWSYSYLKGARDGDEIVIDAQTVRAGRNLAYLECELRNKKDGSLVAKGSQTLYIGGSSKSEQQEK